MEFFNEFFTSSINIILAIIFFVTASVTTFDKRLNQARKAGTLPEDEPSLPTWVSYIYWIYLVILGVLLFINWKVAIALFLIKFILEVLPVLEILGNLLMSPFKPAQDSSRH